MAGKIFINYRRDDAPDSAGFLDYLLEQEFTREIVFKDVDSIKLGDDFEAILSAEVSDCDVFLAVIGPKWLEHIKARRDDPKDFVRIEIKAALAQKKRVIPVLVQGADMPGAADLPEDIRPLATRNAIRLRPERFTGDTQGLISGLHAALAEAEAEQRRSEAEAAAAEEDRRKREKEEAARIAAAAERARAQASAGLSPEEIRKAEELANWDFIKERNDQQALRDHLARFPDGVTTLYAHTRLEELIWTALGDAPGISALKDFLEEFPQGEHAASATTKLAALQRQADKARQAEQRRLQETQEWGIVAASVDPGPINDFLAKWPDGQHAGAARARIRELKRSPLAQRRGILMGAGATIGVLAVIASGWWVYKQWRWQASLSDATLKLVNFSERRLQPGQSFKECETCPEMVVVPPGKFKMGSQVDVTISRSFAVSKYEVTFDEWDACVDAGACNGYKPGDRDWGRGRRPVINVSWHDATAYAEWLAAKTGKPYRLLTEAEWEYAARAGTTTAYSWGNKIGRNNANCDGCGSQWDDKHTAPVGSFKPNAFGLYDMHGNVGEWVSDWYGTYERGPQTDPEGPNTGQGRVLRGGSWYNYARDLRSASRSNYWPGLRYTNLGFRLARTYD
ncbi:MAG: SUMF1/EgtB/PvdO family nonheme iron enzyme [Pseudomonadota bacterium]